MREIKFRAWHTKQKRMYPCSELVADQMTLLADGRFINVSSVSTKLSQIDNREIMIPLQYTGLEDKNGKEIYEGDIMKFMDDRIYGNSTFGIKITNLIEGDQGMTAKEVERAEVIGNIYENPELLGG